MIGNYHYTLYLCPFVSLRYLTQRFIDHFPRCITPHLTVFHLTQQMSTIMYIHRDKIVPLGSVIKTLPTNILSIWLRRLHIFSVWVCSTLFLFIYAGVHGDVNIRAYTGT